MMAAHARSDPDRRTDLRFPTALPAIIELGERPLPATVTNISCGGARIRLDAVIALGTRLALRLGPTRVDAVVKWREADCYGIAFRARVDPLKIVRHNHPQMRGVYDSGFRTR